MRDENNKTMAKFWFFFYHNWPTFCWVLAIKEKINIYTDWFNVGQPKQPDFGIEEKIKKMMGEKSGKVKWVITLRIKAW